MGIGENKNKEVKIRRVSIVIANYNGEAFLKRCLNSLLEQSFKDFETIVVDNGSDDGSVAILERHALKPVVIRFKDNKGFAQAVNSGIEHSEGDLIALLNNDAVPEVSWLENLFQASVRYPEMDFFASVILKSEERDVIESAGVGYGLQCRVQPLFENERYGQGLKAGEVFLASAGAVMVRKKLFERIGRFDADYFAYLEDVDFFLRARLNGARGMLVPDARVYHYGAGTDLKDSPGKKRIESSERVYLIARNRWYLIWDNLPVGLVFLLLPMIFLGWLRGFFYHLFRSGKIFSFVRGSMAGFFSFFIRREKHKMVQALMRVRLFEILRWMRVGLKEFK